MLCSSGKRWYFDPNFDPILYQIVRSDRVYLVICRMSEYVIWSVRWGGCGIPTTPETILTTVYVYNCDAWWTVTTLLLFARRVKTPGSLEIFLKSQNRIEEHNHVKSRITTFSLYIFIEINFLAENSITVSGCIWHVWVWKLYKTPDTTRLTGQRVVTVPSVSQKRGLGVITRRSTRSHGATEPLYCVV